MSGLELSSASLSKWAVLFLGNEYKVQVEHPVTEMITGVDLVQKQLEIASGMTLGISQDSVGINGHSIEARIYAEDAKRASFPSIGTLGVWITPSGPGIRLDSGVRQGDQVTVDFDPMLAKLIVHAPDRKSAIRRMDNALSSFVALGVTTNIGSEKCTIASFFHFRKHNN